MYRVASKGICQGADQVTSGGMKSMRTYMIVASLKHSRQILVLVYF